MKRRSSKQAAFERAWAKVRLEVLERDGKCMGAAVWPEVECGGRAEVHHKLPRSVAREHRLNPDLCVALCTLHHYAVEMNPTLAFERELLLHSWDIGGVA